MDLEHKAIARLQEAARLSEFYYQKPLILTVSGGKDSEVCLELCRRAGVPFEAVHNLTTADAPETIYHERKTFRRLEGEGVKCTILYPRYKGQPTSMWKLIPQKRVPPTRTMRYCCTIAKEGSSRHRCTVLGVRKYESISRADSAVAEVPGKTRAGKTTFDFDNGDERIVAPCQMKATIKIHPIVDWTDRDVWQFLRDARIEMNPCYSMGFKRVGCVGCPMAGKNRYSQSKELRFLTAWSAPHPILQKLSELYPSLEITHQWADEDIGFNCGIAVYRAGEQTELEVKQDDELANQLWETYDNAGYPPNMEQQM